MKFKLIYYSPLEKDDELLKFYRSRFTYKQIGEKFNIPLTTVAYRIKKLEASNA